VHPTPLSVDALSELFQDFYTRADSHIATHIAALSSRLSRGKSPAPSVASRSSVTSKTRNESPARKASGDQQMLTASEITDRKKARRLLELKKTALEEAVERIVCERVYDRIWRHRSTDDEERDQKLRSRIAALSLVGIGLKELLAGADDIPNDIRQKTVDEQDHIRDLLAGARGNIQDMDKERHPLGKLHCLTAAHKSIVETLSQLFPASSSADEILPTLIYALITSSPEHVNVISDLKFIQRFRAAGKVDGEAAYCLVNLEAASSFLETVDLPSLRADENPEGPEKPDRPITPRTESAPMRLGITPAVDPSATSSSPSTETSPGAASRPPHSPSKSQRRLSNLLSMQTNRLNEASDSLRGAVLDSADQAFDAIGNTIEGSFNFLFGRLREHQEQSTNESGQEVILPKTLEDARKLVSTPSPPQEEADDASVSVASSVAATEHGSDILIDDPLTRPTLGSNDRVAELFAGRRPLRDRSADSVKSGGSGKRVAFETTVTPPTSAPSQPLAGPNAAVESVRNFGNTINPLNQFARMGGLFGRPTPAPTPSPSALQPVSPALSGEKTLQSSSPPTSYRDGDSKAAAAINELRKLAPPSKRFVECKEASDLRLGEVEELLREYHKLVAAVGRAVGP
jgi:hypothetical protein